MERNAIDLGGFETILRKGLQSCKQQQRHVRSGFPDVDQNYRYDAESVVRNPRNRTVDNSNTNYQFVYNSIDII